jgi:putative cardiolipin synthase
MRAYYLFVLFLLSGCSSLATSALPSQALPGQDSPLGQQIAQQARPHPAGMSGFYLLASSTDAFHARAELIRAAQHSLDLQYYIVHDGLSTRLLVHELLAAADRGVRIRLLLDDTTSDGKDRQIALLAAHPQIQIRIFNALQLGRSMGLTRSLGRLLHLTRQHRRMHNKLWLADSSAAIVGGRNLGDEYFDAETDLNFTDIDLLGAGPVAQALAQSFDQYWNSALSKPVQELYGKQPPRKELVTLRRNLEQGLAQAKVDNPDNYGRLTAYEHKPRLDAWLQRLIWAHGQALWDAPSKVVASGAPAPDLLLTTQLAPTLAEVRQELILVSAYFVPTDDGLRYLTGRADAGVEVSLMTNSLEATDVPAVHGGYMPYRRALLEHGVRLFELRRQPDEESNLSFQGDSESSLHSKAALFDRQKVFIGSFNFDPRSVLWNTEVGILVDSRQLTDQVRSLTLEGMAPALSYEVKLSADEGPTRMRWHTEEHGQPRVLAQEPGGLWRRFNAWFARIIGLERML